MLKKIRIESKLSNLRIVEKSVDEITSEVGISNNYYGKILISVLEAVNNAIIHGNNSSAEKYVDITIEFRKEKLKIIVKDEGQGFAPDKVPDPTVPENLEEVNGRGVFLMSRLADEIKYSKKGNAVTMIFNNVIS
ncbi:MAG TPA: ATP-binding protein [Bacteroidales bacterium]|nr:ATP-binding protein [Bacteroidales bacterium]